MILSKFDRASAFAAEKHENQRRKDAEGSPYINHPVSVAAILSQEGMVEDVDILCAAMLHDVVEDAGVSEGELAHLFGSRVARIVLEVTNPEMPKTEVKTWQIAHAPNMSHDAKQVKLADKIANLRDILSAPPVGWSVERKRAYFSHAEQVVAGLRGVNLSLDAVFDQLIKESP